MPLWILLFAQAATADAVERIDLAAAAVSSPRPAVCRGRGRATGPRLWNRARDPGLGRFCLALAQGYAVLAQDPKRALAASERAARAFEDQAAPLVLEGRARVRLGQFALALERFEAARALDPKSLEAPASLHAAALAAAQCGDWARALESYRALVPRAALLDDDWERQQVYIEAAAVAMTQGARVLDEAVGYLTEARRRGSPPGLGDYVLGALALALDRQGRQEEAAGVAAGASGPWRLERAADPEPEPSAGRRVSDEPFLPPGEIHAMVAVLAARHDPELERDAWEAFIEARGDGAFVDHARARLGER